MRYSGGGGKPPPVDIFLFHQRHNQRKLPSILRHILALGHGWKILLVANQNILIRFLGHRIDSFSPISLGIVSLLYLLNSEFIYVILNPKCLYLICISMGRRGKYAFFSQKITFFVYNFRSKQHFILTRLFSRDALFIHY